MTFPNSIWEGRQVERRLRVGWWWGFPGQRQWDEPAQSWLGQGCEPGRDPHPHPRSLEHPCQPQWLWLSVHLLPWQSSCCWDWRRAWHQVSQGECRPRQVWTCSEVLTPHFLSTSIQRDRMKNRRSSVFYYPFWSVCLNWSIGSISRQYIYGYMPWTECVHTSRFVSGCPDSNVLVLRCRVFGRCLVPGWCSHD